MSGSLPLIRTDSLIEIELHQRFDRMDDSSVTEVVLVAPPFRELTLPVPLYDSFRGCGFYYRKPKGQLRFQIVAVTEQFIPLTGERTGLVFHIRMPALQAY